MSRALAHIEQIHDIKPIEGADRIELVHVLGWQCIANKGEFKEGDLCVYFEIDSRVDYTKAPFEFMEKRAGKVKTIKLKGQLSQGLALSLDKFSQDLSKYKVGDDVTNLLGVTKIETDEEKRLKSEAEDPRVNRVKSRYKKFMKSKLGKFLMKHKFTRNIILTLLGGKKKNRKAWPDFISKTDEIRIENIPDTLKNKMPLVATEKLDGTSTTFFLIKKSKKFEFGVCSRNIRQLDENQKSYHDHNIYWDMAFKYDIENVLNQLFKKCEAESFVCLQGESIGTVQGNPYKLQEDDFYGYNFIVDGLRYGSVTSRDLLKEYGVKWVPILQTDFVCPDTMEEMKALSHGMSIVNPNVLREGVVYRDAEGKVSFKNVDPEYLLKHNQ